MNLQMHESKGRIEGERRSVFMFSKEASVSKDIDIRVMLHAYN